MQVNGHPAFTGEQANKALKAYKERKKARQKAREEEACYVEYRKAEILAKFKPRVFPKRRKGAMGFGERKAHYLSIRPKPMYATWLGRRRNVIEANSIQLFLSLHFLTDNFQPRAGPSPMAIAASVDMTDHSALPEFSRLSGRDYDKSVDFLGKKSSSKDLQLSAIDKRSHLLKTSTDFECEASQIKAGIFGTNADCPLINGIPFWLVELPQQVSPLTSLITTS
ncbi:unnamed protein product [Thelazia callipaeda]|uniref:HMG box domain-containing protein n=1 Tax=Thelazia callipaeda TaxID=103827 RepID=A0A0N5CJB2_THECL|nr:unnamed protein product [Thelazia callipaeda]